MIDANERQVLHTANGVMWLPAQTGQAATVIAGLIKRKMLEPASKQFSWHNPPPPVGAMCITEKGAKAIGCA